MESDREAIKKWVETWKTAASALDKIRRDELMAFDYEKNFEIIDSMLQYACDHAETRLTSGLVEQQRLFMKLREKLNKDKDSV
ncbi:MAG TPA: hypothetical protein VJL89_02650 [Thermodesulfovibrionia bacterium]|nr:hypothetical protein [Thermodesulfovibrionia bacterium]